MEQKDYKAVVELLHDGYGEMLSVALMDCVECYLPSFIKDGGLPTDSALEGHWVLCTLLKALLKDEYGVCLDK